MSAYRKADYQKIIDDETWAFIELTDSYYPPETIDYSIAQQREIYNTMCRQFYRGHPPGINATDDVITHATIQTPVRRYIADNQTTEAHVMYFHGGGFIVGGLDSHADVCAELCTLTGLGVTAVDYRLAPEFKHPAAFDDALACSRHELKRLNTTLLLCGDSAGGNLAAAVTHAIRAEKTANGMPAVAGQVLIYPGLGGDTTSGSYVTHAEAPMLSTRDVLFYTDIRAPEVKAPEIKAPADATLVPLKEDNFSNLPATVIFSAECDPLCDDGRHYRDAIINAGGKAAWIKEAGLVHGYLRARYSVSRARQSFDRMVQAIEMMADGAWYE